MSQAYCEAESDKHTVLGPSLTLSVLRHTCVDALSPDFPCYWAWHSSAHFQGFLNTSTHSYYVSGVSPVVVSIPKAHVHHHSEDKQPATLRQRRFCTDLGGCYPEGTSLSQEWGSNVVLESGEIHSVRIRAVSEPLLYARHESSKGNQNKTCS